MRAEVNDRIVVAGGRVDDAVREGRIVEIQGRDGAPPYVVEWGDGHRGLYFPGPDAHVEAQVEGQAHGTGDGTATATSPSASRARIWSVQLQIFEDTNGGTSAHALLSTGTETSMAGRGEAHRRPGDSDVPEIGDEIAAARALHRLADSLLANASVDLTGALGHDVRLSH